MRIHPVKQHHEAGLGVEGKCDAAQVSDQAHQGSLQVTNTQNIKNTKYPNTKNSTETDLMV